MEADTLTSGDYVSFPNRITGETCYGQLRFSYQTQLGRHWAITQIKGDKLVAGSRSEKDLTKVIEVPDGYTG